MIRFSYDGPLSATRVSFPVFDREKVIVSERSFEEMEQPRPGEAECPSSLNNLLLVRDFLNHEITVLEGEEAGTS
jgi:hypothetical protein